MWAQLVARCADLTLGTVDASVVAAAERPAVTMITTFDRRHFGAVRPAHAGAFTLLP
jgi:predicted nucleic acid-binding protein